MSLGGHISTGFFDGFKFTSVRPERLGNAEYTLVTLVFAKTQGTAGFASELHLIKRKVVEACLGNHRPDHQRADFVLLRVTEFNDSISEVHGFVPLPQVDVDAYLPPECAGGGQLHDAVYESVGVTASFARTLAESDYLVNGLVVLIACDWDEGSTASVERAVGVTRTAAAEGNLESLKTILLSVGNREGEERSRAVSAELSFSAHLGTDDTSDLSMERVADFIAREVAATSHAIGTGGPSKASKL